MSETKSQVDEFEQSIETIADEYEEVADVFLGSSSSFTKFIKVNDAIAKLHITGDTVSTDLLLSLSDGGINVIRAYETYNGGTVLTVEPGTTEEDQ